MAPLAFTFDDIKIYIYNDDHLPIHIHAQKGEFESVFELAIESNKLVDIVLGPADNANKELQEKEIKKVKKFLKKYWKEVVEKWEKLVVFKTSITVKRISGL